MGLFQKKPETPEETVKRLAEHAGHIIAMLEGTLKTEKGTDLTLCLMYAAGLAGCACHEAVKALKEPFAVVKGKDGRTYYFGDRVNHYLLEGGTSVYAFLSPVCGDLNDVVRALAVHITSSVGNGELKIAGLSADTMYRRVKACWDGIYDNMTARYCKTPAEWPVLFGIVLQNILIHSLKAGAPKEEAGRLALECAMTVSKMDADSLGS